MVTLTLGRFRAETAWLSDDTPLEMPDGLPVVAVNTRRDDAGFVLVVSDASGDGAAEDEES